MCIAARSVAAARAFDNSMSASDIPHLHEQDATCTGTTTSAVRLGGTRSFEQVRPKLMAGRASARGFLRISLGRQLRRGGGGRRQEIGFFFGGVFLGGGLVDFFLWDARAGGGFF